MQVEQHATDTETRITAVRGEGVMDMKLLGKPKRFDGTEETERQFKFTFLGHAGAIDARLKSSGSK